MPALPSELGLSALDRESVARIPFRITTEELNALELWLTISVPAPSFQNSAPPFEPVAEIKPERVAVSPDGTVKYEWFPLPDVRLMLLLNVGESERLIV